MTTYRVMHRPFTGHEASPAVTGTLNQTGQSDEDASTFATFEAAEDAMDLVEQTLTESSVWIEEVD